MTGVLIRREKIHTHTHTHTQSLTGRTASDNRAKTRIMLP